MTEERVRELVQRLAVAARDVEKDIRHVDAIDSATWVNANWLANQLEILDWELARNALSGDEAA